MIMQIGLLDDKNNSHLKWFPKVMLEELLFILFPLYWGYKYEETHLPLKLALISSVKEAGSCFVCIIFPHANTVAVPCDNFVWDY